MFVAGGRALLGTAHPVIIQDCEAPIRHKRIKGLWWDPGAVSIADFRSFVAATDYVTFAEREGWSFVFHANLSHGAEGTQGIEGLEWWRRIEGAHWARPFGPNAAPPDDALPATHINWHDARAYADWAGGRLPKEAEWEHAARGGLGDVRYPWGDTDPDDTDFMPCNIWQGEFPMNNTAADGFVATAPVRSFPANGYGLHHMVGNVWEWTSEPFRLRSNTRDARARADQCKGQKLLKGGSYLCHATYCHWYRIAARSGNTPESTSDHTGFRVVYDQAPV